MKLVISSLQCPTTFRCTCHEGVGPCTRILSLYGTSYHKEKPNQNHDYHVPTPPALRLPLRSRKGICQQRMSAGLFLFYLTDKATKLTTISGCSPEGHQSGQRNAPESKTERLASAFKSLLSDPAFALLPPHTCGQFCLASTFKRGWDYASNSTTLTTQSARTPKKVWYYSALLTRLPIAIYSKPSRSTPVTLLRPKGDLRSFS